jgi:AraC family L-rhamnose operon regulatory protein RhaS
VARSQNLRAQAVYFHPSIANGSFDFETLRQDAPPDGWKESDWQDRHLLEVFIEREGTSMSHAEMTSQLMALGPDSVHQVTRLMRSMAQVLEEQADDYWPCRSRSFLLELLFLVDRLRREPRSRMVGLPADLPADVPGQADVGDDVERLILYLHTHYGDKITLDQLAREFHSNRTTLSERFRTATGQPVMTYLAQLRIRIAAMLLHDTLLPVSEIAARTGFLDLTHFGRAFRKSTGETPSDFRDRTCWLVE